MPPTLARIALDLLRDGHAHQYAGHRWAQAELHLPRGDGPHPIVAVLHGGSWRTSFGKAVMRPVCRDLVRHGWAAWNIEYRRVGGREGGGWPATFDDVAAAIDALAELDAPIDRRRIALLGHSAGGQLALWAAGRPALPAGVPGAGPRVLPGLVVAQAPVSDLERGTMSAPGGVVYDLLGGGPEQVPERYALANPQRRIPLEIDSALVHGRDDATVSAAHSVAYVEAATRAGADSRLRLLDHAAHRDHVDPRSGAWATALAELDRLRGTA